jgi:hypothetical protein
MAVVVGIEVVVAAITTVVPVEVVMAALDRVISLLLVTLHFLTVNLAPLVSQSELMEPPAILKIPPR